MMGVKIDDLKRSDALILPTIVICRICRFLPLIDIQTLSSTCRQLRLLTHAPAIEALKTHLRRAGRHDDMLKLFWDPRDLCLLTGKDLYQDSLLCGGLDPVYRHRFLAQCIGLDGSFCDAVARELRARSTANLSARAKIRFSRPFVRQSTTQTFNDRVCDFAADIQRALIASPPRFDQRNGFLTFLLDSSSSDSDASPRQSDNEDFRRQFPLLNFEALRSECRNVPPVDGSKRELLEWASTYQLASQLCNEMKCFHQPSPKWVPHHFDLADEVYEYLTSAVIMDDCLEDEISRDVGRTLPSHFLFREADIKKALFEVLRAIAVLEPGMGYCQGMNFIAGVLIIETLCPCTAFWTLLAMIRQKSFSGLFCPGVPSLKVKLLQFHRLATVLVPRVARHLTSMGLHTDLIGHQCFVTAFAYFIHPSFLVRIWDAFWVSGWHVFMALGLVILKQLEPKFINARDAESVLRILQSFRVTSSKASLFTPNGRTFCQSLYTDYVNFVRLTGVDDLSHFAIEHFIQSLRGTIRAMELPVAPGIRRPARSNSADEDSGSPCVEEPSPTKLVPPFMLVPRFSRLPKRSSDVQALIVNFVTVKTAKCFQILPVPKIDGPRSKSTVDPPEQPQASVSWCLLASSQQATDEVQKLSVVRGRGTLPLAGFYVLIDARMHTSEREMSGLIRRSGDEEFDPLRSYLFYEDRPKFLSRVSELSRLVYHGTLRDFATFATSLADESDERIHRDKVKVVDDEAARKCQRSASELLKWIRAHHEHVDGGAERRSVGRGGFVIAPLRAIIQAKLKFDSEDAQLSEDRDTFEAKIASIERLMDARRRETEKARTKRDEIAAEVKDMDSEKRKLMSSLHEVVTSPSNRPLSARSRLEECSPITDHDQPTRLWTRLGNWFSRSRETDAKPIELVATSSEAPDDASLSTSPVDSGTDSEVELQSRRLIIGLQKKLRNLERHFASSKQRLVEADRRVAVLEESMKEATEMKITLLSSYHELAVSQEQTEIRIVEDILRTCCDWATEALPLALLRIAGSPTEDCMSVRLMDEVPDLYAELLALPEFWPQFKALFLPG